MALKENLKAIKTELNTEEQFLENFIKGERFIRKYKLYLVSFVIILVLWLVVSFIMDTMKQSSIEESNEIYTNLLLKPEDKMLLEQLKDKNPNLYAIFLMQNLDKNPNDTQILKELSTLSKDEKLEPLFRDILALANNEKSVFLKDYAKILEAYTLLEQKKIEEANIILSQIKPNSPLEQIAKNLKHYQGISQ
ncbi:hypothetical protein [Campylobacter helveticus]|uniref:Tetratricopeptide repeat-like domain-containing protein n=1 Tax=Campylobacter helveticus TaxID=28898 RepID=A0ABY3L3X8_9BACT|nr:hypothetical protein [Campylobacter helveticus]MCR2039971.1 hypothetical protein [Campylobacter helveticus]MCR2055308.1 hypothetical protein [Campylobacter helveticus]TNB54616.1 hypothetical protein FDW47_07065 [Campylobacter helveticus]TNB56912.1 hypothetical protein FDW44_07575 [Campylobacter helveticus]TXK54312.1 hypothetical protein A9726_04745 [Campylobacter helveticus]